MTTRFGPEVSDIVGPRDKGVTCRHHNGETYLVDGIRVEDGKPFIDITWLESQRKDTLTDAWQPFDDAVVRSGHRRGIGHCDVSPREAIGLLSQWKRQLWYSAAFVLAAIPPTVTAISLVVPRIAPTVGPLPMGVSWELVGAVGGLVFGLPLLVAAFGLALRANDLRRCISRIAQAPEAQLDDLTRDIIKTAIDDQRRLATKAITAGQDRRLRRER